MIIAVRRKLKWPVKCMRHIDWQFNWSQNVINADHYFRYFIFFHLLSSSILVAYLSSVITIFIESPFNHLYIISVPFLFEINSSLIQYESHNTKRVSVFTVQRELNDLSFDRRPFTGAQCLFMQFSLSPSRTSHVWDCAVYMHL